MKKITALIIGVCLIAGLFSACGKNENSATVLDTISYTYDSAYHFDDLTVSSYEDLCKAVVWSKEEVRINPSVFDNAMQLFYTSFPLNALIDKIEATSGAYVISYKNKETAHNDVLEFIKKIHGIYQNSDESDTEKLIKIYNNIASSIKVSENSAISCYETIMTGEGTSFSYSNMFEYVLQQKGINAYHILCEDESGSSKAMSAAEINGEMYYFDVFAEYENNKGTLLKYFGMNSEELEKLGYKNLIYTNRQEAAKADGNRFSALRNCTRWEIEGEKLVVTDDDGNIVQVAL